MSEVYHDVLCRRCKSLKDCIEIPVGAYQGEYLCLDCGDEIWNAIMNMDILDEEESKE